MQPSACSATSRSPGGRDGARAGLGVLARVCLTACGLEHYRRVVTVPFSFVQVDERDPGAEYAESP
jgi:hypothetical protein